MNFCPACGKAIEGVGKFCVYCGSELNSLSHSDKTSLEHVAQPVSSSFINPREQLFSDSTQHSAATRCALNPVVAAIFFIGALMGLIAQFVILSRYEELSFTIIVQQLICLSPTILLPAGIGFWICNKRVVSAGLLIAFSITSGGLDNISIHSLESFIFPLGVPRLLIAFGTAVFGYLSSFRFKKGMCVGTILAAIGCGLSFGSQLTLFRNESVGFEFLWVVQDLLYFAGFALLAILSSKQRE